MFLCNIDSLFKSVSVKNYARAKVSPRAKESLCNLLPSWICPLVQVWQLPKWTIKKMYIFSGRSCAPKSIEKLFECPTCNMKFANIDSLHSHIKIHDKSHQCEVCLKWFESKSHLTYHMKRTHTGEKSYACSVCGKKFARKETLQRHQATHKGEKPYACSVCDKRYSSRLNLTNHMRTHTGERANVCLICDKSFATKHSLQIHLATHSDERKFKCDICPDGRYFKTKQALIGHMVYHDEPKYCCVHCNKKFHTSSMLKRHVKIHFEPTYACAKCDKKFATPTSLKIHMEVHSEETHACAKCGRKYKTMRSLKRHEKLKTGCQLWFGSTCFQ